MKGRIFTRLAAWALASTLSLGLLVATALPASAHTVVRRYYRQHHYSYPSYPHRVEYVRYGPVPVVPRYYHYPPCDCRWIDGYYYHPSYGRHFHSHAAFGVHVVF
jgi:hypothetical protein